MIYFIKQTLVLVVQTILRYSKENCASTFRKLDSICAALRYKIFFSSYLKNHINIFYSKICKFNSYFCLSTSNFDVTFKIDTHLLRRCWNLSLNRKRSVKTWITGFVPWYSITSSDLKYVAEESENQDKTRIWGLIPETDGQAITVVPSEFPN